ncbi:MAG TPA: dihydroorotase [Solirubrobacterales bacterium]|nr:dihydroorotase [Solirubrobacterales bacterium]
MSGAITDLDWRGHPGSLVISGARAFDSRAGLDERRDIVIREGRIAELAPVGEGKAPEGAERIDAEGLLATPAFFDPHVHLRHIGQSHKEDVETGTRSAAAGGYCGVIAMANTAPPTDEPEVIAAMREQAADQAAVPTGFVATVTVGMRGEELTEMAALREAGAVGFSDDGLPLRSAQVFRRALQYQHLVGGNILLHEEDPNLSAGGVMGEGEVSAELGMAGVPDVSESTMISRDAALCLYEGARAHVQHLSGRRSVEAIEFAKQQGSPITAEVTPHHLVLTDEAVRSLDARFKMNPPLRTEDDRQALIDALRSGTIDCIGTDHAPHASHEKEIPFEQAMMGVTGLETAFSVIYTDLIEPGVLGLDTILEGLTSGAALFDLEVPSLQPDAEANVTLIDLEAEWEAGAEGWESRSANSCFAGRRLRSRPVTTIVAGSVAYRQRAYRMGAVA